jgi:rhodanese-related sulfurtransferase
VRYNAEIEDGLEVIDTVRQLSPTELAAWLKDDTSPSPMLLDVREPWEFQVCHIEGSTLVPMNTIPSTINQLDDSRTIVCICHHGVRSMHVVRYLEQNGFEDVINLQGGISAWAAEIDPKMPTY